MAGLTMMSDDSKIMSLVNIDINWSQYPDRFLTFGNDLKLYLVDHIKETPQLFGGIQLNEMQYSQIMICKRELRNVKVMACNNTLLSLDKNVLFALGHTNGKILIESFDSISNTTIHNNLVGKEFYPKSIRSCNNLDFSPFENNLLASGFDKTRSDYSVMVWDIANTNSNMIKNIGSNQISSGINNPLFEFGLNEMVHSLKWYQNRSIICGMNNKHIKIFDLRDIKNPKVTFNKGVHGITTDPYYDYRFASYCDNYIYVWDIRNFETPLITIGPEVSGIVKIEWCPTRSNVLAALLKDTNNIKLYEYKDYNNSSAGKNPEPSIFSREISPFEVTNTNIISSFSWHPDNESQMTVISSNGLIRDFKIVDRITLNWSPISEIIWTHGKKILQCIDSRDTIYEKIDDIAVRMRKLAIDGYGLSSDKLWQLFPKYSPLYYVWKWISIRIKTHNDEKGTLKGSTGINATDDLFSADNHERLFGILGVLFNQDKTQLLQPSELVTNVPNKLGNRKIFTSLTRAKALRHCGWSSRSNFPNNIDLDISGIDLNASSLNRSQSGYSSIENTFDDNMPCQKFVKTNESEFNFSRSAAVLVFNGKIYEAIECLKRAADLAISGEINGVEDRNGSISLNAIALALSAYMTSINQLEITNHNSLWIDMCSSLKPKLVDPYIKAIFSFLSFTKHEDNCYDEIINDDTLDIADRVAFACMYLSDSELISFLLNLKNRLFEKADLSAILLTGVTEEGLELFSKYVECTCDVQTISLILLWSLPNLIYKKPLVVSWIENYKQLLDCWRLWNVRAHFDIKWYAGLSHSEEPRQRIYASCNYCRSPIAFYTSNDSIVKAKMTYQQHISYHQYNRASTTNSSSNKHRTCTCSNCSKTLPRCSLCLTQLGTPAGIYWRPGLIFNKTDPKLSPFSSWFSWCQSCRHGGHASHLLDWFAENTLCPVAGCKCKCMAMDANARLTMNSNL